ncbi:MAG: hypothetical protein K6E29_02000 [Cyanobacteria bacterium RUI128]|nr:hypothetical protein [Cyanobacteria bacterium RUI128]
MKRTLAILGLLVCTTGVVFAEETPVAEITAPQQVEVQSQLDRQTFDNRYKNGPKFDSQFKNVNDNIKYDKSVKGQKFSPNKDNRPLKFGNKTSNREVRGVRHDFRNDRFNPNLNSRHQNFRYGRPAPYMGHHQKPYRGYRAYNHRNHNMKNYRAHNNRNVSRRAYNKNFRTR